MNVNLNESIRWQLGNVNQCKAGTAERWPAWKSLFGGDGWVDEGQLERLARPLAKGDYGIYLSTVLEEGRSET